MITKIAFRSILRHKRRTILSAITIAAGLLVYIFMNSILSGFDKATVDNLINLSTGAIKIQTESYNENKESTPLDHGIPDAAKLAQTLRANKLVREVTPRTRFMAQLSNYSESVPVVGIAVDEATDTGVFSLIPNLEGAYFSSDNAREMIIGKQLAQDLGVGINDYLTLYALTRYDSRNADEFRIVGILNTTDPMLNRSAAVITQAAARDFLELEGLVTELDVSVHKRVNYRDFVKDVRNVKMAAERSGSGLVVQTFEEQAADILKISKVKSMFSVIFMMLIQLIAAVGIFNTVFMSVYERVREIGVLRAHGFAPSQIVRLFLLEGVFTGVAGSVLGLTLGCLLNWYLVVYGYPIDKIAGDSGAAEFPVWGTIYGQWNIGSLLFAFLFGIAVAIVAAILPARRASQFEITRALRFN